MSRGEGRIERAVRSLLNENPCSTFTGDDLVLACFPGINRIEKKHKVSALRAASSVALKLHWTSRRLNDTGGSVVFFNSLNLRSFAVGMTRRKERGQRHEVRIPIPLSPLKISINERAMPDGAPLFPDHRIAIRYAPPTEGEAIEMLVSGRNNIWVRTDGPYPLAVEAHRAEAEGKDASALWDWYNDLVKTAVYLPDKIVGETHPDFLIAA